MVGDTSVVGTGAPLTRPDTPERKPVPVIVVVKPGLPAISGTGRAPKLVRTGAALPNPEGGGGGVADAVEVGPG